MSSSVEALEVLFSGARVSRTLVEGDAAATPASKVDRSTACLPLKHSCQCLSADLGSACQWCPATSECLARDAVLHASECTSSAEALKVRSLDAVIWAFFCCCLCLHACWHDGVWSPNAPDDLVLSFGFLSLIVFACWHDGVWSTNAPDELVMSFEILLLSLCIQSICMLARSV
jgi:hypothetical protein